MPTIGLEFSGESDSLTILKWLKDKGETPLLLVFIHKGAESAIPQLMKLATEYECPIVFKIDLDVTQYKQEIEAIEYPVKTQPTVIGCSSPLIDVAHENGISVLYHGRRRSDNHSLKTFFMPRKQIKLKNLVVKFPLWRNPKKVGET
jgi:hypothetical protein